MTPKHMKPRKSTVSSTSVKAVGVLGLALASTATSMGGALACDLAPQYNATTQGSHHHHGNADYGWSDDWYQPSGWNDNAWNNISGWGSWGSWDDAADNYQPTNPVVQQPDLPSIDEPDVPVDRDPVTPNLPDNNDAAENPAANNKGSFDFVYQRQGQTYGNIDCGPSVLLMALNHAGKSPSYYNPDNLAGSLERMRAESIRNVGGLLNTNEIPTVLSRYGVHSTSYTGDDAQAAISEIKQGKSAIALGQTGIMGPEDGSPGYGHYVYVSGYNSATGKFTVANPLNSNRSTIEVSEDTLRQFLYSNLRVNPTQNLITF